MDGRNANRLPLFLSACFLCLGTVALWAVERDGCANCKLCETVNGRPNKPMSFSKAFPSLDARFSAAATHDGPFTYTPTHPPTVLPVKLVTESPTALAPLPDHPEISLAISIYLTNERDPMRFETFQYTVRSYRAMQLHWKHVYLNIKLCPAYEGRKNELEQFFHDQFPDAERLSLTWTRPETKEEYRALLLQHLCESQAPTLEATTMVENEGLAAPDGTELPPPPLLCPNVDHLVLFLQNDDHVFVNFDADVVLEGLQLLQADTHPYKAIYMSHWPELLKLSGKLHTQERAGNNYVRFIGTLSDTVQIFNVGYLYHVIEERPWVVPRYNRVDGALVQCQIANYPTEPLPSDGYNGWTAEGLEHIYVPLRELFRHYDGYGHVGMDPTICPPLERTRPPQTYTSNQQPTLLIRILRCGLEETNLLSPWSGSCACWNCTDTKGGRCLTTMVHRHTPTPKSHFFSVEHFGSDRSAITLLFFLSLMKIMIMKIE